MEIYLYANTRGTFGAPDSIIAFESREAVNAYIKRAYEWVVLCTIDKYGKMPEGAETLDEFRKRVWDNCVSKSELWTETHVAKDWEKALEIREERRQKQRRLAQMEMPRFYRDPNPVDLPF